MIYTACSRMHNQEPRRSVNQNWDCYFFVAAQNFQMDLGLDEYNNVTDVSVLDSDTILQARYSILASAGVPRSSEPASLSRGSGHPSKRYLVACRPKDNERHLECSFHDDVVTKRDWVRLVLKSRDPKGRASKTEKPRNGRGMNRASIFSLAISAVLCFFFTAASLQGSVTVLPKRSNFQLEMHNAKRFSNRGTASLETDSDEYNLKFVPWKFKELYLNHREASKMDEARKVKRLAIRRPRLALVCANLEPTPEFLYLITLWKAVEALGYDLELFSLKDGPMHSVWLQACAIVSAPHQLNVDWSRFEGVILSSLNAKLGFKSLMQDPFKGVPIIWIIYEEGIGRQLEDYKAIVPSHFQKEWKRSFERADVVLFSDYTLPMEYSLFDTGNYFVLPGSPAFVWEAEHYMILHTRQNLRESLGLGPQDISIVIVGSPFIYKSVWREHAIVMKALLPVLKVLNKSDQNISSLKLIFLCRNSTNYGTALQVLATQFGFPNGSVSYYGDKGDNEGLLWAADAVVYSSLHEEQAFPSVLVKAMVFERPILAPNITVIRNHLQDGVHAILFNIGDIDELTSAFSRALSEYGVTDLAQTAASECKLHVRGLLVENAVEGFAELLENVLQFPSEARLPLPITSIPLKMKNRWQWQFLDEVQAVLNPNHTKNYRWWKNSDIVDEMQRQIKSSETRDKSSLVLKEENADQLTFSDLVDAKNSQLADEIERNEEEELEDRHENLQSTWEEVYRSVKRAELAKSELHERDDGELERTGQPICIYEPYTGAGTWPFLHQSSPLYRGVSLRSHQRRMGFDDIEASVRLPLLNDSYYQSLFCEFGAFLAIANRIDRIHKNAWIGFQSWQAHGRKVSLSSKAEEKLNAEVRMRTHGDCLYFWASIDDSMFDGSGGVLREDFWTYCDAVNSGNCRDVFLRTFKKTYGLQSNWTSLPPMPLDGDRWSTLHCWAMPTSSFLEFVMFTRMFVSELDSEFFLEHHDMGKCPLGVSKLEVQHCYCKLLELLVNVWAYHSGRRMIFLDPNTGSMQEQHSSNSRHGKMWIKFFSYNALKSMDGDLAEEADDLPPNKRWLWPQTGEVFCQQISERERQQRYTWKIEKRKRDKERVKRIRSRHRQHPVAAG